MKRILSALTLALTLFSGAAQAGIVVGGTRLIYSGDARESSLRLTNTENSPFLIQSWVETTQGTNDKSPFIITPPVFRLDGKQEFTLRVIKMPGDLPQDRESMFWLNVKAIPATSEQDKNKNKLIIAIKNQLKLIYRPATLTEDVTDAYKKVTWVRNGKNVTVKNDSAFYINFNFIKSNAIELRNVKALAPRSSANYLLPDSSCTVLTWQSINDYGGSSPIYTVNLK